MTFTWLWRSKARRKRSCFKPTMRKRGFGPSPNDGVPIYHSGHSTEVERMILFFPVREWRLRSQRSCPRGDATSTSGAPHANSFSRSTPRKFEREQADPDAHPRARTGTGRAVRLHRDEAITTNIAGLFHRNRRIVAAARSTKARSGLGSTRCRPKLSSVDDLSRCSGCARAPNC